jgi:phenylalanyl-tRNA synthetase beta chain
MKISEQWLREWVSPKLDTAELAECLTLGGLEVGSLEPAAGPLQGIVVGKILDVRPHPNAERLRLCSVDAGQEQSLEIVCGADNAAPGVKAPVALPGTRLPNGSLIERSEIRGVESQGMLCSAVELGLAESASGLLLLANKAAVGTDVTRYLKLDDTIYEIELTPNRGDCLSVAGIAREVGALTGARLKESAGRRVRAKTRRTFRVKLKAGQDCPRYVGRVIEDVNPAARTPDWMVERLRRAGVRSINPVVDVTNYVMLELGQPMHAFDLDLLAGHIEVRHAREKERLKLLDGTEAILEAGTLVIGDKDRAVALAGIMGGLESAVSERTRNIFLESAYFNPETIAGRARGLGLQTESSYRFERGVDPQLQGKAIERATALLQKIVGGRPGSTVEVKLERYIPQRASVSLRRQRIAKVLDVELPASQIQRVLGRLGMRVSRNATGWRVTPPSWRFDIEREIDLIEELARVHGYERLPTRTPRMAADTVFRSERLVPLERFKTVLVDRDYQEVITYSFVDPELQALIAPDQTGLKLLNPISSDMSVMRVSLWPGLLQSVRYNRNRQQQRLRLFEVGRHFVRQRGTTRQDVLLGGAVTGAALPEQWGLPGRDADFFDAKGDVEALLRATGYAGAFGFASSSHPALHPGQQARILKDGVEIGRLGALHPELTVRLDLEVPVFLFELTIFALQQARIPRFREVSRFPAIRRDLAVVVDVAIPAQAVLDCVAKSAGELLVDLQLFDEYRGEGIDSGRKSLALGLTLQDSSRTLKEEVVDSVVGRVIHSLESGLGAELRKK